MNPSDDTAIKPQDTSAADERVALEVKHVLEQEILEQQKPRDGIDGVIARIRDKSPDWLVNSGSRISFSLKSAADGLSVWSAVRKGSQSPWRLAGSLITLAAGILGTQIPEKKIPEEKQQEYAQMSRWKYFLTKTREAIFNPKDHIAETSGFALILNGFCLAMSGIVQSSKNHKSKETIQGVMTAAAGLIMTYMPDRERAWQLAHTTFMVRSVPAAFQAHDAYFKGNPEKNIAAGDWQQGAKWILNQIANVIGTLYGGVKKLPDGSIVHIGKKGEDVTAPGQSRRKVLARGNNQEKSLENINEPGTMVSEMVPETRLEASTEALAV